MSRLTLNGWVACTALTIGLTGCHHAKMKVIEPQKAPAQQNTAGFQAPPVQQPAQPIPMNSRLPDDSADSANDDTTAKEPKFTDTDLNPPHHPAVRKHVKQPKTPIACKGGKNCASQEVTAPVPPAGEDCGENQGCLPLPPEAQHCKIAPLSGTLVEPKMDILIVVDTSASLTGGKHKNTGGELGAIARSIGAFLDPLDPNMDYHIGLMLAHGPASQYHGKLFAGGSEPVLKLNVRKDMDKARAKGRESDEKIKAKLYARYGKMLEQKILNVKNDRSEAQGEAMLLSLYDSVTNAKLLAEMKSQGMFRDNAALAVIIISDEQDVCYDYNSQQNHQGNNLYTPVQIPYKDKKGKIFYSEDRHEKAFRESDACQKAVNGTSPLTPDHVYDALKALKGDLPAFVTGIMYTEDSVVTPKLNDENEVGHGMLDLIARFKSPAINLGDLQKDQEQKFWNPMGELGKFADSSTKYPHDPIVCRTPVDATKINSSTVEAHIIDDRTGKEIAAYSAAYTFGNRQMSHFAGKLEWTMLLNENGNHSAQGQVVIPDSLDGILRALGVTHASVDIVFTPTE